MDHLDEVAGAGRPGMDVALFGARIETGAPRRLLDLALAGGKRGKDRIEMVDRGLVAADHQAIAALEAPDPARGADIDITDAGLQQVGGAADIVLVVGIAAIDQDVIGRNAGGQMRDGALGDLAGRQHHPDGARAFGQGGDQSLERFGRPGAFGAERRAGIGVDIVHGDIVAGPHQPFGDIAPHAA